MRIGWAIETVGCFGSVREMVEISNALIQRGHDVTIYHPRGGPVVWLPSLSQTEALEKAARAEPDVMIAFSDFTTDKIFAALEASKAQVKAIVLAGFEPTEELGATLRGERPAASSDLQRMAQLIHRYWVLPDSEWQRDWLRKHVGVEAGPGWGGVNLEMFHPVEVARGATPLVLWSGDPRARKDGKTVQAALELVRKSRPEVRRDSYWGKGVKQADLAAWISAGDVWVDGHLRAGWCNPVVEAMACGVPVVCTDIPATCMIAEHGRTAYVVQPGEAQQMAHGILTLLENDKLRQELAARAYQNIVRYDYDVQAAKLERAMEDKLRE